MDRRAVRSRRQMRDALMELIMEKGYDAISVQDITDRADLARATFYLHYKDKDELLTTSLEEVYYDLVARLGPNDEDWLWSPDNPVDLIAFEHVAENIEFYRVILGERGVAAFVVRIRFYLVRVAKDIFTPILSQFDMDDETIDLIMHNQAGALIATLSWWIENNMPKPADEMARFTGHIGLEGVRWAIERARGKIPPSAT